MNPKVINASMLDAQTAAANSAPLDGEPFDDVLIYTVVSGFSSGSVTPCVDASPDGGTSWFRMHTGTAIAANGSTVQKFSGLPKLFRIAGVGTMNLTYTMHVERIKVGRT